MTDNDEINELVKLQADRIAELESLYWQQVYKNIPPQTNPLSDEEILEIYIKHSTYDNDQKLFVDIYGFARAILRKAWD